MKKRMRFIIGGSIIVVLLGYLVVSGFNQKTMVYYKTVKEVRAEAKDLYGKGVRLSGKVKEGSLQERGEALEYRFALVEGEEEVQVHYHGVLPDIFKEGNEAIVEGRIHPDLTFEASHVFTKCPSKYEGESLKSEVGK